MLKILTICSLILAVDAAAFDLSDIQARDPRSAYGEHYAQENGINTSAELIGRLHTITSANASD